MNREIKFRAFTKKWGMVYPDDKDKTIDVHARTVWQDCRDEELVELMQFTGLKDKNGKEIYEDDIVSSTREIGRWLKAGTKFAVRWNPYLCNYALCPTTYKSNNEISNKADLTSPKTKTMTVLGNIFENPELVK